MYKSGNKDDLRRISLRVKGLILKNQGLTSKEIFMRIPEEHHECLISVIRMMTGSGMVIDRNNKYYTLGHSVRAKAKRHIQKQRKAIACLSLRNIEK